MRVRGFLRKEPQPVTVRVTVAGGEKHLVKVDVSDPRRWARAEETVEAMGARALECLDAKGNVLRAVNIEVEEEKIEVAKEEREAGEADPMLLGLGKLAAHLNAAHNAGAERHENAYKMAFELLSDLTKQCVASMLQMSKSLERANKRLAEVDGAEAVDPADAVPQQMIMLAMQKMMGGSRPGLPAAPSADGDGGVSVPPEVAQALASVLAQSMTAKAAPAASTNGTNGTTPKGKK